MICAGSLFLWIFALLAFPNAFIYFHFLVDFVLLSAIFLHGSSSIAVLALAMAAAVAFELEYRHKDLSQFYECVTWLLRPFAINLIVMVSVLLHWNEFTALQSFLLVLFGEMAAVACGFVFDFQFVSIFVLSLASSAFLGQSVCASSTQLEILGRVLFYALRCVDTRTINHRALSHAKKTCRNWGGGGGGDGD